jgi:hypothetical protein
MEILKDYQEHPKTNLVKRDWDDKNLPVDLETFSFSSQLKFKEHEDKNGAYPYFPEFDFSVSRDKLDSVSAQPGDIIRIEKLAADPVYHGDGVIKIVNETKKESATIKNWEETRKEGWKEFKEAA